MEATGASASIASGKCSPHTQVCIPPWETPATSLRWSIPMPFSNGMLRLHLIDVAVTREAGSHPTRGLGGPTLANAVGQHHVITLYIQRLARLEHIVGDGGHQEALASVGSSVQQQH